VREQVARIQWLLSKQAELARNGVMALSRMELAEYYAREQEIDYLVAAVQYRTGRR
jgi:hypothetical protein